MKTYTKGKKTKGAEKTPALTKGAPRIVDEHSWFYIDRKGLLIVHEAYARGYHLQTDSFIIPWKMVEEALKTRRGKP